MRFLSNLWLFVLLGFLSCSKILYILIFFFGDKLMKSLVKSVILMATKYMGMVAMSRKERD